MIKELKPFKRNQVCYYLMGNRIHKGVIKAEYQLDNLNMKYLVENGGGKVWMIDHSLYHSVAELVEDLKSLIIG